jgi:hypothetical protein
MTMKSKLSLALITTSASLAAATAHAGTSHWWNVAHVSYGGGGQTATGTASSDPATAAALAKLGFTDGGLAIRSEPDWMISTQVMWSDCSGGRFSFDSRTANGLLAWPGGQAAFDYSSSFSASVVHAPANYVSEAWVEDGTEMEQHTILYNAYSTSPGSHAGSPTFPAPLPDVSFDGRAFDFPDAHVDATGTASFAISHLEYVDATWVNVQVRQRPTASYAFTVHIPGGTDRIATLILAGSDAQHEVSTQCSAAAGGVSPQKQTVTGSGNYQLVLRGAFAVPPLSAGVSTPYVQQNLAAEYPLDPQ